MNLLIAIIVVFVAWKLLGKNRNRNGRDRPRPPDQARHGGGAFGVAPRQFTPAHKWSDGQNFDFEIVGEASYQDALRKIVGGLGGVFVEHPCVSVLVPEDTNRHDNKAVAVFVEGLPVGYLSREDARRFRRRLGSKKLAGMPTAADAVIRGGGSVNGQPYLYGVWLDMKPFD